MPSGRNTKQNRENRVYIQYTLEGFQASSQFFGHMIKPLRECSVKQEPQDALLEKKKQSILTIIGRREAVMERREQRAETEHFSCIWRRKN